MIAYAGMEPIVDDMGVADRVFTGTAVADQVRLRRDATTGKLVIESDNDVSTFESITFDDPTNSLTILLGFNAAGTDEHVIVEALGDFAASLFIHGTIATKADFDACVGDPDAPPDHPVCPEEDGPDTVSFDGSTALHGGKLAVFADTISVGAGISLDTRQRDVAGNTIGDLGSITFVGSTISMAAGSSLLAGVTGSVWKPGDVTVTAQRFPLTQLTTLLPIDVSLNTASVSMTGVTITGGDISIAAKAVDRNLWEDAGTFGEGWLTGLEQALDQVPDLAISSLTGITGQISVRYATATVTVTDSSITSAGDVAIESSARADASIWAVAYNGVATGGAFAVSIAYGQATAIAESIIDGTTIVADGDVSVTASAETAAFVKSRTGANLGAAQNGDVVAIAIGIANTTETAHVTMTQGSSISSVTGGVLLAASGAVTNLPWVAPSAAKDGSVAFGFGLDIDHADIKTTVDGTIDAGGTSAAGGDGFEFDAQTNPSLANFVSYADDTIRVLKDVEDNDGHGLVDGQAVYYAPGASEPPIGCICLDGTTALDPDRPYYIWFIDETHVGLSLVPTLPLHYEDPGIVTDPIHTISRLTSLDFVSSGVDKDTDEVTIIGHPFIEGQVVRYIGTSSKAVAGVFPVAVGGLVAGNYVVHVVGPDTIQLFRMDGTLVDITSPGVGAHTIVYETDVAAFDPSTDIDEAHSTIVFTTPHGFVTGDRVIYRTDQRTGPRPIPDARFERGLLVVDASTLTIAGDRLALIIDTAVVSVILDGTTVHSTVASVSYDSATDLTTVVLADPVLAVGVGIDEFVVQILDPVTKQPLMAQIVDAPIDGLVDGLVYYVVRVDDLRIRLTGTRESAEIAGPIDFVPATDSGLGLGVKHTISPIDCHASVCIRATLEASNALTVSTAISDPSSRTTSSVQGMTGSFANLEEVIGGITGAAQKVMGVAKASPVQGTTDFGVAGAVGITVVDHLVEAIVGSHAVIRSSGGIEVTAKIAENYQVAVTAGSTKPEDGAAETSVAVAVGVGVYKNIAHAWILGGARLDAAGEIDVTSEVGIPFSSDGDPATVMNPIEQIYSPDAWQNWNDGTLGLSSNIFNNWVMAQAGNAEKAIGLAIDVNVLTNVAEAIIWDGALINQTPDDRFRGGEQGLSVAATILVQLIGLAGVGGLNFSPSNFVGTFGRDFWKGLSKGVKPNLDTLKEFINPFGAEGNKDGVGASIYVEVQDNTSTATIQGGARVSSNGDVRVSAGTETFTFILVEAGGKGGSGFSVAGAISVAVVSDKTIASLGSGAIVETGGALTVDATDTITRINLVGGVVSGSNKGIGVSIGVNVVVRDTKAFIGADAASAAGTAGTSITASGPIDVTATNDGGLWTATLAGAVIDQQKPTPPPTADELIGQNAPGKAQQLLGTKPPSVVPTKTEQLLGTGTNDSGLGLAGDISVNVLVDTTSAAINDTGTVTSDGAITVDARSDTAVWSLAGAVAIVTTTGDSKGIAGSVSVNIVMGDDGPRGRLPVGPPHDHRRHDRRGGRPLRWDPVADGRHERRHIAERQGRRRVDLGQHHPR